MKKKRKQLSSKSRAARYIFYKNEIKKEFEKNQRLFLSPHYIEDDLHSADIWFLSPKHRYVYFARISTVIAAVAAHAEEMAIKQAFALLPLQEEEKNIQNDFTDNFTGYGDYDARRYKQLQDKTRCQWISDKEKELIDTNKAYCRLGQELLKTQHHSMGLLITTDMDALNADKINQIIMDFYDADEKCQLSKERTNTTSAAVESCYSFKVFTDEPIESVAVEKVPEKYLKLLNLS